MWEDTSLYKQIMESAYKWSMKKDSVFVKATWVKGNGEFQTKRCHIPSNYVIEWFENNLDAYWAPDEAEMKIVIEDELYYWKHPTVTSHLTIADIEKEDKRLEEEFNKSVVYVNDHILTFGGKNE